MTHLQHQQTYTTAQVCEVAGITAPRVHQMRNGQKVKAKNGQIYEIKPTLQEGVHWIWKDSDVQFLSEGLKAVMARRTKVANRSPEELQKIKEAKVAKTVKITSDSDLSSPKKRGRPAKVKTVEVIENKILKKRGRPPKVKTEAVPA